MTNQIIREIGGSKVEFFQIKQRKRGKMLRKMLSALSKVSNQDEEINSAIVQIFDMPVFDEITEMIYPDLRIDGKNISDDLIYEQVMAEKEKSYPLFEIELFNAIIEVYLGESLTGAPTKEDGSPIPQPEIVPRKIGSAGGSGVQS